MPEGSFGGKFLLREVLFICIYIRVNLCIHINKHIYTHIHPYIYTCTYICMCVCIYIYIYILIEAERPEGLLLWLAESGFEPALAILSAVHI